MIQFTCIKKDCFFICTQVHQKGKNMKRKRVTEVMPFLTPLRSWQKNLFYQMKMHLSKTPYARHIGERLPFTVAKSKTTMINPDSGQDIIYQENKVDNLKLISKTMNRILIKPGETFSFCYLAEYAKKYGKYKDGLVLLNGVIDPRKGGGVCHISNLLYYLFLHTPLTIVERHGHDIKSFPDPDSNEPFGIDATINSGWLDLKVRNDTPNIYQICIDFDTTYMYGKILCDREAKTFSTIKNGNIKYVRQDGNIYEIAEVIKVEQDKTTKEKISETKLYDEKVRITYDLPKNIKIEEEK